MYGSSRSAIKSRLIPYLGTSYFGTGSVTADASLAVLAKEREVCHNVVYYQSFAHKHWFCLNKHFILVVNKYLL